MNKIMNTYNRYDLGFEKGEGSYLTSSEGVKYLDFTSGIAVVNLGHSNREIADVICRQANTLIHTSNLYKNNLQVDLANKISSLSFGGSVFFCNSGAEANEAAIKLVRIYGNKKYGGRKYKILTMENSFHGRTFATISATGQDKVKKGFEPLLDFIEHVKLNDIDAVKDKVLKGDVIGIIVEVIQGEGGVIATDLNYLKELREICDQNDIVLVYDEVQTGIGRTGFMFGYQLVGVEPDVFTLAKALGNGFPIGAMAAKDPFAKYLEPGTHATTFGGNFLACAVANKVLDIISDEQFLKSVSEKGIYLKSGLEKVFGCNAEIRGAGLLLGACLKGIELSEFIKCAFEERLLVVPAGNNTARFYPPLTVSYEELDEGLDKAASALAKVSK